MWTVLMDCLSSQASEESTSPFIPGCGRSFIVSEILTPKQFSCPECGKEHWIEPPFGTTSLPSERTSFPVESMSSTEDSRASLLASLETAWRASTPDTSSLKSLALYQSSDPNLSFSKTFPESRQHDPLLAYVAGLIDGEGCLAIQSSSGGRYCQPEVTVGMSDKALHLLKEMHATFGGSLNKKRDRSEKWNGSHSWRIGGAGATRFVSLILPYLILKRPQAELIMELDALKQSLPAQGKRRLWSEDAHSKAKTLKIRMHQLNLRGPDAPNAEGGWYSPNPTLFGKWEPFKEKWPRFGMTVAGQLFQPRRLEPRTSENGGFSWPTPTVCGNDNRPYPGKQSGLGLAEAVRRWPTPVARDHKSPGRSRHERTGHTNGDCLPQAVGGQLNPMWVEWLMGYPLGWTVLEAWVTRSSLFKRVSRSKGSSASKGEAHDLANP